MGKRRKQRLWLAAFVTWLGVSMLAIALSNDGRVVHSLLGANGIYLLFIGFALWVNHLWDNTDL
jgi:membrane-bound ClpP family serine protease